MTAPLRFGVHIPTCIEGMMYPVPFARPEDIAVSDDGTRARAWMRPLVARYLAVLHGQSILADAGLDAARTQPFRDALAAGRTAADLVSDELLDAVAIAGTPAQGRAALARWAEAGLDGLVAVVPEGADLADQIERLGTELTPA